MQLKPEIDLSFENVFSMSGMPDQNLGFGFGSGSGDNQNDDDGGSDRFPSYLGGYDDKANSLKRASEDDLLMPSESSNKRTKSGSDFAPAGFQQQGESMAQIARMPEGIDGNLFNAELERAAFAQQQMDLNTMNDININSASAGFGGAGIGRVEMRMEQESNRQQQQSAMLANEMALISHMGGGAHQTNTFGNSDTPPFAASAQRPQLFADNNSDLFNSTNALPPMSDLQNLQGWSQLSSMSSQPFLSNMLDFSLLNNNRFNQGLGGFNGGTLPLVSAASSSLNQSLNQQMSNSIATSSQVNQSSFGQIQGGFSSSTGGVGGQSADPLTSLRAAAPAADTMSSLSPLDVLQLTRMNSGVPSQAASLQQQQQAVVPQQQPSSRAATDMTFAQPMARQQQQQQQPPPNQLLQLDTCQPVLPPLEQANTPHYSKRPYSPFSVDEDPNWLSEFQCFIRSEILELFRVSQQGIKVRNALKSLTVNQVGIRCRYCAHLQHGTRANRASCFPSKIDKIYQSFTMMLREHFPSCSEIPEAQKQRFMQLQNMNAQGASNAKGFWEHAAKKKGLVDISEENGRGGIHIFESTQAQAALIPPFGAEPRFREPQPPVTLIHTSDRGLVSRFLYTLMEQVYRVHLAPSERKGNRKSLRHGMPGFGCRYCYEAGRMGLCRLFPARRRTIHTKIPDLFDHMKRCPLCPQQVKDNLIYLHNEENGGLATPDQDTATRGREREFFERIWARLGHQDDTE